MKKYFGFIDETGVLNKDPIQKYFGLGLLLCEDTSVLYEELSLLKNRAIAKMMINETSRKKEGIKHFEFKFSSITRTSHEYYCELIDLYLKFEKLRFCCLMIDKSNPNLKLSEAFPSTWDAYISFSKVLIRNNVKDPDKVCIIADYLGKPKANNRYYEPEINTLPFVFNSSVLESHASLYIQLVDVLLGSVSFDFRRNREKLEKCDIYKAKVCDYLKMKLSVNSLSENMTIEESTYFSVWEFEPSK